MNGGRTCEDEVAEPGASVVVDAELDPGDPAEPGGDVGPDAGQRLRDQRRYPPVQYFERLLLVPAAVNEN